MPNRTPILALLLVAGCSAMNIDDFAGKQPALVLEQFFDGHAQGWGVMQTRFGTLQRQFRIEAEGHYDQSSRTLDLTETYRFDDGQVDELRWTIKKTDDGHYVGQEPRLNGEATGSQAGNAFHWTYQRRVPTADGETTLDFDDWFWLQDGGVLISRASTGRFGVELGTLSVFYQKKPQA